MSEIGIIIDFADRLGLIERVKHKLMNCPDEAADKLVTVLAEISKISFAADDELTKFLSLHFDADCFLREERSELLRWEGNMISARMHEARGHCHKIENIYQKYLSGWFDRALNSEEADDMRMLFDLLGNMDDFMVRQIGAVTDWIAPKATEVLELLDQNQVDDANQLISASRKELLPVRQKLAEINFSLQQLQAEFIAVSGTV